MKWPWPKTTIRYEGSVTGRFSGSHPNIGVTIPKTKEVEAIRAAYLANSMEELMTELEGTLWKVRTGTGTAHRYKVLGMEHAWPNDQPMIRFSREDDPKKTWSMFTWDFFSVFKQVEENPDSPWAVKIDNVWHICRKEKRVSGSMVIPNSDRLWDPGNYEVWYDIEHGLSVGKVGDEQQLFRVTPG